MFMSNYGEMLIVIDKPQKGAYAAVIFGPTETNRKYVYHAGTVVNVLFEKDYPKDESKEVLEAYKGDYDFSGEFIEEDFTCYVWIKERTKKDEQSDIS